MVGLGRDFIANARLTFPQTSKISGADSDLDPELKEYKVKDGSLLLCFLSTGHWRLFGFTCHVPKMNFERLKNNLKWFLSELTNKFINPIRKASPLALGIINHTLWSTTINITWKCRLNWSRLLATGFECWWPFVQIVVGNQKVRSKALSPTSPLLWCNVTYFLWPIKWSKREFAWQTVNYRVLVINSDLTTFNGNCTITVINPSGIKV